MTTLPGFTPARVPLGDVTLSVHRAGAGAPLILLHGFPQTHATWARVAPVLAQRFDVIVPDLRGYGASDAPADDPAHHTYSKRRMAADIVALMQALGIGAAHVLGHDRGARVGYRLALDHPERVLRLGILEIVPTGDFWAAWSADLGMAAYHWTFLAQPAPMPERLIGADPQGWLDWTLRSWTRAGTLDCFPPESLASYRAQIADPAHLAAMCADYRAGFHVDRALDEADRAAGRQIACPVHFLHADRGFPAQSGDPAALWAPWAPRLTVSSAVSGHFVTEEAPDAVLAACLPFFSG